MTKKQLDRVSTHMLGHALVDRNFRKRMAETMEKRRGDHEAMARAINEAIAPETPLRGADIPALRKHLVAKLRKAKSTAPTLRVASLAASCGLGG